MISLVASVLSETTAWSPLQRNLDAAWTKSHWQSHLSIYPHSKTPTVLINASCHLQYQYMGEVTTWRVTIKIHVDHTRKCAASHVSMIRPLHPYMLEHSRCGSSITSALFDVFAMLSQI